jgi:hypothetical protein
MRRPPRGLRHVGRFVKQGFRVALCEQRRGPRSPGGRQATSCACDAGHAPSPEAEAGEACSSAERRLKPPVPLRPPAARGRAMEGRSLGRLRDDMGAARLGTPAALGGLLGWLDGAPRSDRGRCSATMPRRARSRRDPGHPAEP